MISRRNQIVQWTGKLNIPIRFTTYFDSVLKHASQKHDVYVIIMPHETFVIPLIGPKVIFPQEEIRGSVEVAIVDSSELRTPVTMNGFIMVIAIPIRIERDGLCC